MPTIRWLILALALPASPLAAQSADSTRPRRGKIDGVEREKNGKRDGGGGGCDCGISAWFDLGGHALEGLGRLANPRGEGRGFLSYPYAGTDVTHPFTVRRTREGRTYGTVAAGYFDDVGSTLAGAHVALEGTAALAYGSFEFHTYWEPLATETDRLHSWRAAFGVAPRLGTAILRTGLGLRSVILDDGTSSLGPELEVGVQAFPRRPFGVNVTARLSPQAWSSGGDFLYREVNTSGSVFIGRVEIQAGWHWVKIGDATAFGGPTIGSRIWF